MATLTHDEEKAVTDKVAQLLKTEYSVVHKDDWRMYLVRTIATIFLVGGVTIVAVLGVVYGSATAITNREVNRLAEQSRTASKELEDIKTHWQSNQEVSLKSLRVQNLELTDAAGKKRGSFSVSAEGHVSLVLFDDQERQRISVLHFHNGDEPEIRTYKPNGDVDKRAVFE